MRRGVRVWYDAVERGATKSTYKGRGRLGGQPADRGVIGNPPAERPAAGGHGLPRRNNIPWTRSRLPNRDTADLFTEASHGIDKGLTLVEACPEAERLDPRRRPPLSRSRFYKDFLLVGRRCGSRKPRRPTASTSKVPVGDASRSEGEHVQAANSWL